MNRWMFPPLMLSNVAWSYDYFRAGPKSRHMVESQKRLRRQPRRLCCSTWLCCEIDIIILSDVCGILFQWLCMCFLQFDVVPIGAWDGQGRKSAWLSPFLLAVGCPIPFQEPVIRPFAISYSHPRYLDSYESYANALLSQKFDQISIQLDLHNLQKLPPVTIPVFWSLFYQSAVLTTIHFLVSNFNWMCSAIICTNADYIDYIPFTAFRNHSS